MTDDDAVAVSRIVEDEAETLLRDHDGDDPWAIAVLIAQAVLRRLRERDE